MMSKSRNRNRCLKLPTSDYHPLPEVVNGSEVYFGERIEADRERACTTTNNNNNTLSSTSDGFDSAILSIQNLSTNSSGSILSWGEDYKNAATKLVQQELEKMDRILAGMEPIPPHYDRDEYEEWMELFPNLRILNRDCVDESSDEDTISGSVCDIPNTSLPSPVMDDGPGSRPESHLANFGCSRSQDARLKRIDFEIENFLKISPISHYYHYNEEKQLRIKQRQRIDFQRPSIAEAGYLSMPYIAECEKMNKRNEDVQRSALTRVGRKSITVLPPIDNSQFRSISATPRFQNVGINKLAFNKIERLFKN